MKVIWNILIITSLVSFILSFANNNNVVNADLPFVSEVYFLLIHYIYDDQKDYNDDESRLSLPKLADQILQLVERYGRITTGEVIRVTNAPRSTVKKYLSILVAQNYLVRHGQGRTVWYTKATRHSVI